MKKLIALLLAVVLTFSLAACGAKGPDLLGTYTATMDMTDYLAASFDEGTGLNDPNLSLENYLGKSELTVIYEFREDGTFTQSIDIASWEVIAENMKSAMAVFMDDLLLHSFITQFASMGITVETKEDVEAYVGISWDQLLPQTLGISLEEFLDELIGQMSEEIVGEEVIMEGKYKAEDGKLYASMSLDEEIIDSAYETYELSGNTVTITGGVNVETNDLLPYPIVLTKVEG